MDALNIKVMVSADNQTGARLEATLDAIAASPHKDRFRVLCGIDLNQVGPGWAERAVKQLEADVAAGAVGVGEISKGFGLSIQKADGSRLKVDDPELDPIWQAAARLDVPVFIHTAEPQAFFAPHDFHNERWLELALFPGRAATETRGVTFEELVAQRNRLFARNPKTRFIAAHFGWHANDLARASAMLDAYPNVVTEVGAILYDIGRQPRAAHDFFVKYQDRILFGKDSFQPAEYPYYWRVFETKDEWLRLLPRLPRVLEAVRRRPPGRGAEEGLCRQRAARGEGAAQVADEEARCGGRSGARRHGPRCSWRWRRRPRRNRDRCAPSPSRCGRRQA